MLDRHTYVNPCTRQAHSVSFIFTIHHHLIVVSFVIYRCNRVYCIHVPGHDPITFSFRSFSFLIGWGFYGPNCLKPILNWANVCSPEHTSDTSTNYDSFLNWTFSSPNMVRTVQTLLHSQLARNEMQASARTWGRRAADSMIENVG